MNRQTQRIANHFRAVTQAWVIVMLTGSAWSQAQETHPLVSFQKEYCYSCHSGSDAENNLDLTKLGRDLKQPDLLAKWVRIHDRVEQGEMPPKHGEQPPPARRAAFLRTLRSALHKADAATAQTVIRRLNRVEYENTLHDLLGVRTPLRDLLPEDGKAHGFDNVGAALDISPVHLQRYLDAANQALDDAVCRGPKPPRTQNTYRFDEGRNAENIGKHWHRTESGAVVFFNEGKFPTIGLIGFRAPHAGRFRLEIHAHAYQSERPITFAVYTGSFNRFLGSTLAGFWQATPGQPRPILMELDLNQGDSIRLMPQGLVGNFGELRRLGPAAYQGPGLAVIIVNVNGPMLDEWPQRGHRLLFGDLVAVEPRRPAPKAKRAPRPNAEVASPQPKVDSTRLITKFVSAAYRRPVTEADVAPFVQLAHAELAGGATFEDAMRSAHVAVLCSPGFLYLRENPGILDDIALANRLAYFLWGGLPMTYCFKLPIAGN